MGIERRFSSIEEVEHFLEVIRLKNMPPPLQFSQRRDTPYSPNGHGLSRLPAKLTPYRKREKIIPIVEEGLKELKALYGLQAAAK